MSRHRCVRVTAPAKVNLGLEVLGRRADGYHEIRSVLAMIELADELTVTITPEAGSIVIEGVPGVPDEDNLIRRAVDRFAEATGVPGQPEITVAKRIPAPAGLGGASSDAASTLLALNALHGSPLSPDELRALAATLGSDVPFFLGTPVALVSGRGTDLTPLPPIDGHLVIAIPRLDMSAKTAKLYAMLANEDFSDGSRIAALAGRITNAGIVDTALLGNAFARPLAALVPGVADLTEQMRQAGCPHVALSGAGPAHYAIVPEESDARVVATRLGWRVGPDTEVIATRFRRQPMATALGTDGG